MNKHGDYPNTLAEKSGFSDLRQFMDEYVVCAGMIALSSGCGLASDAWLCLKNQETAAILKSHFEGAINTEKGAEVYELMSATSEDIMMKYSGCPEDIYESMLGIDPECAEDLCKIHVIQETKCSQVCCCSRHRILNTTFFPDEVMSAVNENPEEAMLRKFFQGMLE